MNAAGSGFMLLLFIHFSSAVGNNFTYSQWSQKYLTQTTRDVALSMALDDGDGFIYLVGRTEGPRGQNVSLPGLIYNNAMSDGEYDKSRDFRDATIARVSKQDGTVLWAKRLFLTQESKFSAVALSTDRLTVYAAGTTISSADNHPIIVQAFDADTGQENENVFEAPGEGRHIVSSLAGHENGVYVCGRASREIGTALDTTGSTTGGIIVGSVSKSGSLQWLKQGGEDLESDICSGLALSEDQETLFMTGTSHRQTMSSTSLGLTVVYALSADQGGLIWKRKVQQSADTEIRASAILAEGHAVYVLTSLWTESDLGRKIYLHKLSRLRGTLLWSKETCCTSILDRDFESAVFDGKGSATPISGMAVGPDRYVYHLAYYRRKEEFTNGRYGTVVVRIGEYGGQRPQRDISLSVESFQIIASEPKIAVISAQNQGIYVLSNDMPLLSEDVNVSIPSLNYVSFNQSSERVISKPSEGPFYINLTLQLHVSSVTVGAVSDVLAEKLRLSPSQIGFTSNQSTSNLSQLSEANLWIKLYGGQNDVSTFFDEAKVELIPLFTGTGQSEKNSFERHFGIATDTVNLVDGSVNRVEEGLSVTSTEEGDSSSGSGVGSVAVDNGQRQGGFNGNVFGIAVAGLAGTALVVFGLLFVFRRREKPEESFVAPSFHGRPAGSNGEDMYYSGHSNSD